jgi:hypothetical protein
LLAISRDFSDKLKTSSNARVPTQAVVPTFQSIGLRSNRASSFDTPKHGVGGSSVYSQAHAGSMNSNTESNFAVQMERFFPPICAIVSQLTLLNATQMELSTQVKQQATSLEVKHVSDREQWQVCFFSSPPAMA